VDVPDLTGKMAIVTSANSGIDDQFTLQMAQAGATVVQACRNTAKSTA
jgi:NAD(P)-dependent dehydrogenase (short-subunit alcohol dehydrogenase family)